MDIVIVLSLSIYPHLHIRHTKFIGYSDNLADYIHYILYIANYKAIDYMNSIR